MAGVALHRLVIENTLTDGTDQAIILGCTEIPLALPGKLIKKVPLIDPVLILARALIREACPEKLKPLSV